MQLLRRNLVDSRLTNQQHLLFSNLIAMSVDSGDSISAPFDLDYLASSMRSTVKGIHSDLKVLQSLGFIDLDIESYDSLNEQGVTKAQRMVARFK